MNDFNPDLGLKLVADDWKTLRGCDVFRLLDTYGDKGTKMARAILKNRADLSRQVLAALLDLADESAEIATEIVTDRVAAFDRCVAYWLRRGESPEAAERKAEAKTGDSVWRLFEPFTRRAHDDDRRRQTGQPAATAERTLTVGTNRPA